MPHFSKEETAAPAAAGVTTLAEKNETKPSSSCVLRLFGANAEAVQDAVQTLPHVRTQCASRGAETLVALQADSQPALEKAAKNLRAAFPNDLYGRGEQTLAVAVVSALERRDRLLACADAAAGALLEPRLEGIENAARIFDFGAMSYADERTSKKIERQAAKKAGGSGNIRLALTRVQATIHIVGADLAAGILEQDGGTLLFVGTHKGCWVRPVAADENAALWLLDMVRRAACNLKQVDGTYWQRYRGKLRMPVPDVPAEAPVPTGGRLAAVTPMQMAAPVEAAAVPHKRRHAVRIVLVLLLLLALVGLAGAWYTTGGDLAALPEMLGFSHQIHSGAQLV